MTSTELLSIAECAALPESGKGPCVYFLWRGHELLYIGGTTAYSERIERHWRNQRYGGRGGLAIPFDRSTRLGCLEADLWELEERYLLKYQPPYSEGITRKRV